MSSQPSINAFVASESDSVRKSMGQRSLHNNVPHLVPILESLPPRSVVCDVGCGPGSITLDIAKHYPDLQVLGLDIDSNSIQLAKSEAEAAHVTNVRYNTGDVTRLLERASEPGFEAINGGCDLVYSHMCLMHVPSRLTGIQQMRLAAKPSGGIVSLKEADFGIMVFYPESPGLRIYLDTASPILGARGADTHFGRKLIKYAMNAGFERDQIEASVGDMQFSSPAQKQYWAQTVDGYIRDIRKDPSIKDIACIKQESDWDKIIEAIWEWSRVEYAFGAIPSPVVICRR